MSDKRPTIRSRLSELMNNDVRRLQHFSISAVIFFIGYGMIHWCEQNMPPSLEQELTTLALLLLTATAFLWAITMQILYILSRTIK